MAGIPPKFLDLVQKKAFAQLATLMPDGSPQVTPVWFDYDGKTFLSTAPRDALKIATCGATRRVLAGHFGSGKPLPSSFHPRPGD